MTPFSPPGSFARYASTPTEVGDVGSAGSDMMSGGDSIGAERDAAASTASSNDNGK